MRHCRTRKFTLDEARKLKTRFDKRNRYDLHQFHQGLNIELEHRDITCGDPILTSRIALRHLRERKDYYTRLKRYVER